MLTAFKNRFRNGAGRLWAAGSLVLGLALSGAAVGQSARSHSWNLHENKQLETVLFVPDLKDTLAGSGQVKTRSGKPLLPKGFTPFPAGEDTTRILYGNFTLLVPRKLLPTSADTAMHYSYGFATFNQQGQFLHHPYVFDNGPDYWHEGRRRIVADGKMGMVNRQGKQVIPPGTYRFLEQASGSVVLACRDCSFYNPNHEEHGGVFKGTDWDVLDVDGNVFAVHVTPSEKEVQYWQQMPRPFRNSATAQQLAAQLLTLPQVAAYAKLYSTPLAELQFKCYDFPSPSHPYYLFGLESNESSSFPGDDMQVLISPDGKTIFHLEEDLQRLVPERDWKVAE